MRPEEVGPVTRCAAHNSCTSSARSAAAGGIPRATARLAAVLQELCVTGRRCRTSLRQLPQLRQLRQLRQPHPTPAHRLPWPGPPGTTPAPRAPAPPPPAESRGPPQTQPQFFRSSARHNGRPTVPGRRMPRPRRSRPSRVGSAPTSQFDKRRPSRNTPWHRVSQENERLSRRRNPGRAGETHAGGTAPLATARAASGRPPSPRPGPPPAAPPAHARAPGRRARR